MLICFICEKRKELMYFIISAGYHLIFNLNINFTFKHVCLFFKSGRDRDSTHNPNFTLLPSGRRYRSFVPSTIADLNKIPHWILRIDVCVYIRERVYTCIQVNVARQVWAWMIIYDHISTIFVLHICMFFCEMCRLWKHLSTVENSTFSELSTTSRALGPCDAVQSTEASKWTLDTLRFSFPD